MEKVLPTVPGSAGGFEGKPLSPPAAEAVKTNARALPGETPATRRGVIPVDKPTVPTEGDWNPLFNGKDLTGWTIDTGPRNSWRVDDGNLVVTGPGDWKQSGFVLNDREVSNFILRFEFQPSPGSNSGVTFRATPDEFIGRFAQPLQIELLDRDVPDIKNGSFIWSTSIRVSDMLPPDRPVELLPGGSWNRAEVELNGDSLRVTINGNRVLTTDLNRLADRPDANPALKRRAGHIGFQSLAGTVRFRKIELKEQPPTAAEAVKTNAPVLPGKTPATRRRGGGTGKADIAAPFRVATNGLAGRQFIDPLRFGPDPYYWANEPRDPAPWANGDAFAELTSRATLVYPRLPVSRYVCEVELTVHTGGHIKVCLGDPTTAAK